MHNILQLHRKFREIKTIMLICYLELFAIVCAHSNNIVHINWHGKQYYRMPAHVYFNSMFFSPPRLQFCPHGMADQIKGHHGPTLANRPWFGHLWSRSLASKPEQSHLTKTLRLFMFGEWQPFVFVWGYVCLSGFSVN